MPFGVKDLHKINAARQGRGPQGKSSASKYAKVKTSLTVINFYLSLNTEVQKNKWQRTRRISSSGQQGHQLTPTRVHTNQVL